MPETEQDVIESITSTIWSITNEISKYAQTLGDYSQDAADKLERGFDNYADTIRSSIRHNNWVPDSMKPPAPRPPPPSKIHVSMMQKCTDWVDRNRAFSAAIVGFVGTSAFLVYRHKKLSRRKRKARRASSGAKTEVVVLAGSPYSQTTKSIALDLEKRGFLVYIPTGHLEEEIVVSELRVANIRSLNFDVTSADSTSEMIEKLSETLKNPHRHGTERLHFASLVVVESHYDEFYPEPTQNVSTSKWSGALTSRVLYPISVTQAFLPLLIADSAASEISEPTTLVFVSPSNLSSINAPTHARQSVTIAALTSYIATLRAELPRSLLVSHIRVGSLESQPQPANKFDMALARIKKLAPSTTTKSNSSSPSRHNSRPEDTIAFTQSSELRKLHHGIFDAVVGKTHGTIFLGRGALLYAMVGALAPSSLVGWMMGFRQSGRSSGGVRTLA